MQKIKNIFLKTWKHNFIFIPILVLVILRIPSLFWGWWYPDENIYLAVASDINHGELLYVDTWDNKPPLIYILYALIFFFVGNLAWVYRLFNIFLGALTLVFFYNVVLQIFEATKLKTNSIYFTQNSQKNNHKLLKIVTILFSLAFGFGFESPLFNGENLFIPLVLMGFYFALKNLYKKPGTQTILAGIFWGLASFTKFHALIEVLVLIFVLYILKIDTPNNSFKNLLKSFFKPKNLIFAVIWILPTFIFYGLTFTFYASQNYLNELNYGLFGFSKYYLGPGSLPVLMGIQLPFISILEFRLWVTLILIFVATILFLSKKISRFGFVASTWLVVTIFCCLISDRPYMHYFLQVLPSGFLALYFLIIKLKNQNFYNYFISVFASFLLISSVLQGFIRPVVKHFWDYYSYVVYFEGYFKGKDKDWQKHFSPRTVEKIEINSKIVEQNSLEDDYIYIFGDDPGIYGVSNRKSASYQVTVFNVASFEWPKIFADIKTNKPSLILVENHRDVDQELDKILETNYQVINQNQYYTVWKDKHS